MNEPINLVSQESRDNIAHRLRHLAEMIQTGDVTAHSFKYDAEWKDIPPLSSGLPCQLPTGKITLSLAYWTTKVEDLKCG